MSPRAKVAVVLTGYVLAFGIAYVGLQVRLAATNTPEASAASGMYAFGDTALFAGVFFIAALPATGAALFFLRKSRVFWAEAAPRRLAGLSPLRILAAPMFMAVVFLQHR